MTTLAQIETAVDGLPLASQKALLKRLSAKLHHSQPAKGKRKNRWPVPPPKVDKAESRRVDRRIRGEFGRVEPENWK